MFSLSMLLIVTDALLGTMQSNANGEALTILEEKSLRFV